MKRTHASRSLGPRRLGVGVLPIWVRLAITSLQRRQHEVKLVLGQVPVVLLRQRVGSAEYVPALLLDDDYEADPAALQACLGRGLLDRQAELVRVHRRCVPNMNSRRSMAAVVESRRR